MIYPLTMNKKWPQVKSWVNENLFFVISIMFVLSLPFSESLLSISSGLIALQVFYPANYKQNFNRIKNDKALWALSAVFLIYLSGCLFCRNWTEGFYELKKSMFWIVVPFGVALSYKLTEQKFWLLIIIFIIGVTLSTFFTTMKIASPHLFEILDLRDASYVSHVSFSLQIAFSIFLLGFGYIKKVRFLRKIKCPFIIIWCLWLLVFLNFQKSLTGIIALLGTGIVFFIWYILNVQNKALKIIGKSAVIAIMIIPLFYISYVAYDFYHIKDQLPDKAILTESGNKYTFDINNKLTENGYYIYWYLCHEELEKSWGSVSTVKMNENDAEGNVLSSTLIRYITSKGLRKDSAGVAALTEQDIKNIENGIDNHIFYDKRFFLYPRIYQSIWELDRYFKTGNPNDQSLSQRIEFSKAALYIIKNNIWGIGTGNSSEKYNDAYHKIDTQLDEQFQFMAHNQYLSYVVKFGTLGLLAVIFLIISAIKSKKQTENFLVILLLLIIGLASMGETTLETHIGLPFFLYFLSLLLWHSPVSIVKSTK